MLEKMKSPKCEIKTKQLGLPPKNKLIPKDFDILPANETYSTKPVLLKQFPDTDLWYLKDDKFERPKAVVNMKIYTTDNNFGSDVNSRLFFSVWNEVATEYLREFSYMA